MVRMKIYNPRTNISLLSLATSTINPNPLVFCSSDGNCITSLKIFLTPGYAGVYNITSLACSVENFTNPFKIYSKVENLLDFNGKFII
jgi:hypothetical protein